jgi:iron(III) transport system ATP-binding protein
VPTEPALEITDLEVAYGGTAALRGVSLSLQPGEMLALLGPSGSGKSTLLHAVAGFHVPRSGSIHLAGADMAGGGRPVPPERRDLGVVFQNYALWPHLTALDTVAYPVRRRGTGRAQARVEALEILRRLGVAELADRRPAELSGGEQQRVGLARALAVDPDVLLMDEPFASVDAQTRALARRPSVYLFDEPTAHLDTHVRAVFLDELAERRRDSGAAAVYATHDAEEALGLADRVALLRDGRLLQVGSPQQVYEEPVDGFTARLTGPASVLDGGRLLVRPGWARLGGSAEGTVRAVHYRGAHSDYVLAGPRGEVLVREPGPPCSAVGDRPGWTLLRGWPLSPGSAAPPTGSPGR